jgi:hypothetical protein
VVGFAIESGGRTSHADHRPIALPLVAGLTGVTRWSSTRINGGRRHAGT